MEVLIKKSTFNGSSEPGCSTLGIDSIPTALISRVKDPKLSFTEAAAACMKQFKTVCYSNAKNYI